MGSNPHRDKAAKSDSGLEMRRLIADLYQICRIITGNGIRETLHRKKQHISVNVHEFPTRTNVFDWTFHRGWNMVDVYVANSNGDKIIDFVKSNFHVLNDSPSVLFQKQGCSVYWG